MFTVAISYTADKKQPNGHIQDKNNAKNVYVALQ
jgi:hypothetical protein